MARKCVKRSGHGVVDGRASREEVVIHVTRKAFLRLGGGGSWSKPVVYRLRPSKQYPMQTRVARMTLREGLFYPNEYWRLVFKAVPPPYEK